MKLLRGETVTVLRESRDPVTGISSLVEDRTIDNCGWNPAGGRSQGLETTDSTRARVETGRALYTPPGSGLAAGNRVRFVDSSVWEVIADADAWRSPLTGWTPGDHVVLKRIAPPS